MSGTARGRGRRGVVRALAFAAALWLGPPAPAAAGNAAAGAARADDERCVECHGVDGQGPAHGPAPDGRIPRLAGQSSAYMLKQIRDFRSGARRNDTMNMMARTVADEDMADIAAYFAALAPMAGEGGAGSAAGLLLYVSGDPARGVVPCAACHGIDGRGSADGASPAIGGQNWRYLDKQLRDWRNGERRNGADGVMNRIAGALTDAEIRALADHLSALR